MRRLTRNDSLNVIPFIDIMLVLLVMVLTTTTLIKQGVISVELPKASNSAQDKEHKELSLVITAEGELFIDKKKLTLPELKTRLSRLKKEDTVVLRADKNAKFQDFVSVMDLLKELKHESLYIVTQK